MPKTRLEFRDRPLLDIVSLGRAGPKGIRLSAEQIAVIERTIRRAPEVMVKVLPKDGNTLSSVRRHFSYIGRDGSLELETDDGERVRGKDAGQRLVEDWDLDLDEYRKQMGLTPVSGRSPRLVHKIVVSMPPGTPAKGVLEAARTFAREEFRLNHRWQAVSATLVAQGRFDLASDIQRFLAQMPLPRTEREQIAVGLLATRWYCGAQSVPLATR